MDKKQLNNEDIALIEHAKGAFNIELSKDWHGVSAAVQLDSGYVETGFVVECNNPILGACAEQTVIGKVLERISQDPIKTIVAVREREPTDNKVVPPCGRCREFIADYASDADVIIFDEDDDVLFKVNALDLLPFRYKGMP